MYAYAHIRRKFVPWFLGWRTTHDSTTVHSSRIACPYSKPFYDTQQEDEPVEIDHEQPLQYDHTLPTMHDAVGDEYADDDALFDSNGNDLELCNDGTSSHLQHDASASTQQTNQQVEQQTSSADMVSSRADVTPEQDHMEPNFIEQVRPRGPGRPVGSKKKRGFRGYAR